MKQKQLPSIRKAPFYIRSRGFTIIEVLLAIAFFSLMVTALVGGVIYGRQSTAAAGDRSRAVALAEEAIEAVQSIRDQSWNEFKYNQSAISLVNNKYVLAGEGTTENIDSTYLRTINFSDVCRSTDGDIVDCPGDYIDKNTKKAVAEVSWAIRFGMNYSVQLTTYLTNWGSNRWTQTNWIGGPGQNIWSDITKYLSDDGNVDFVVSGEMKLKSGGGGSLTKNWVTAGGKVQYDQTNTDFNQGSFSQTQVNGSGVSANLTISKANQWRAHPQSGTITSSQINCADSLSDTDIWAGANDGKILHYNGTIWSEFVDFGNENVLGIDMLSASSGWAVGQSGKIWYYNGTTWSEFIDFGSNDVNAIEMINSSSGWAVGQSAKIYYYNGTTWAEFTDLGNFDLNTVDMVSASDGWTGGSNSRIYRYNGTVWSENINIGGGININKIFMLSSTDGWAALSSGKIYRWNGSIWAQQTDTGNENWTIYILSASSGWTAGTGGLIYYYNGTSWTLSIDTGNQNWKAIMFTSPTKGWAFGSGGNIYYYDNFYYPTGTFTSRVFDSGHAGTIWKNVYWTEVLPAGGDVTVSTRTGDTPTPDGTWTVWSAELTDDLGSDITSNAGRYLQYRTTFTDGTDPSQTPLVDDVGLVYDFATGNDINDIEALTKTNAWAVANAGQFLHWDGTGWVVQSTVGTENINALDPITANDIWAVGDSGKLYHYNGSTWSETQDTGTNKWFDIKMLAANNGWAVGDGGLIYHYNGTTWSQQASLGNVILNTVYLVSGTDGWAAGSDGKIFRYNGTAWTEFLDTGNQVWYSIYMLSATDGWAVGSGGVNGLIYHWDGTSWTQHTNIAGQQWNSTYEPLANDGWTVGTKGEVYHYNGTAWTEYLKFGNQTWNDVHMLDADYGWLVGKSGEIRLYEKSGGGPVLAGAMTSSAYNMGSASSVQVLEWDETIPVCLPLCTIKIQLRAAPDAGGVPGTWSAWYGATGIGTYFTNHLSTIVPQELGSNQWLEYRAEFAGDGVSTPALNEIRVDYQ